MAEIDEASLDRAPVVMAAAAMGTAAVIVFALLPVLVGVFADHFMLDDIQAGLVASSYFSVYALIALTSVAWIRRYSWIKIARVGFLAMLCGLLVGTLAPTFAIASLGLVIVGAGAGLLFPVSLTLVSDMQHTDRAYAIKLCVEQMVPAALLFLLSSALFSGFGLATTLLALIAVVGVCWLLSGGLPASGDEGRHLASGNNRSAILGFATLVGLGIGFAGFAGLWSFLERIAVDNQFDESFTRTWLAVGLITSGLGPLLAAVIGDRWGRLLPMCSATVVAAASLLLLGDVIAPFAYAAVLTLLPLSYYFSISYMFGVVAAADHNGKIAGLISFALAVGAGTGPALFGTLRANAGPVVLAMGLLIVLGAGIMVLVQTRLTQAEKGVVL